MLHPVSVASYAQCFKNQASSRIPLLKLNNIYPKHTKDDRKAMSWVTEKHNRTISVVTCDEAITYCNSIGMRFPTNAE